MFKRKLLALKYPNADVFDYKDEKEYRTFIVWLENQKIRLYTIEDRERLDDIEDINWVSALNKYLDDLGCQINHGDRVLVTEWLLSTAVRLEYGDNVDKYNSLRDKSFSRDRNKQSDDFLENLNYNSPEFANSVAKLQQLLNIPHVPDDTLTNLKSVSELICQKLNPIEIQKALNSKSLKDQIAPLVLQNTALGFDTSDAVVNEAAKILRLLYIKELRKLQTKINETIVELQLVTANPKTDSSLGKVGF